MKQAVCLICLLTAGLIILVASLCYGEELLNPYCYGGTYCVETSILREPKNGLPPFGEMVFQPECYINSYNCNMSTDRFYWKKSIEPLTIDTGGVLTSSTEEIGSTIIWPNFDTVYINAESIKKVCIKHLDATRCADSLLLWELISKMEESK